MPDHPSGGRATRADVPASRGSVVVADDQAGFRALIRRLLASTSCLELIGEADSGEAALELVRDLGPDIVLLDVRMPGRGGIESTRGIKAMRPETVVIIVSTTRPDHLSREAETCGADEVLWKADLRAPLLENIWRRHAR
jgi:DNA-binding NarL/FixJ family response regulator